MVKISNIMLLKNRITVSVPVLLVMMLVGSSFLSATAFTKDETVIQLPAETSIDWWSAVQSDISKLEYNVSLQENSYLPGIKHTYQAPNREQNLRTYFTHEGIRVIPRTSKGDEWTWGLSLKSYGFKGDSKPVGEYVKLFSSANRIEYRREGLTERYVNDERGLGQGFTLDAPPEPNESEQKDWIIIEMDLYGDLKPNLNSKSDGIDFTTSGGVAVLHYNKLHAFDATGRDLPVKFAIAGKKIDILVDANSAAFPVTIDPLTTSSKVNWTAEGDQESATFGWSISSAGDVNGDGYSDVIIGADLYDNGEKDEGMAFVYHGSSSGLSTTADWTAEGGVSGVLFGFMVSSAGDVNGDGYSDVIIGAPLYTDGVFLEGKAFVYHGSPNGLGTSPAWSDVGKVLLAFYGVGLSTAGDVNGDGYSDIIIGADSYNSGEFEEGKAFLYHGSSSGLSTTPDWTGEGDQISAYYGFSVSTAGDVNGDGYSDVIVGANGYDNGEIDEGKAFVYMGSPSGLSAIADWTVESDQAYSFFSWAVYTAGDVNDDGYGDVIIGAPFYDNGEHNEGVSFVYHGSASGLSTTPDWMTESNQSHAFMGRFVSTAGDVNGDGYSDVIIGAHEYDKGEVDDGIAFVYYGSSSGLSVTPDWTTDGDQSNVTFGRVVSTAGDVNGDGYSDVIVSAPFYKNGESNEGKVFLYMGSSSGLGSTADWKNESNQELAFYGISLSSAGDVNGDGYSDVIVGAHEYDNGQIDEGAAFVYNGSPSGLSKVASWSAEGNQTSSLYGISVSTAGDVNGDGYSDVIVGAYQYDNGEANEGGAFVYLGSSTGLGNIANWKGESDQINAFYGISVSTAGDVNGDGYSDVVVGANGYDNGEIDEGGAFLYLGSSSGLSNTEDWVAESNEASAFYGISVSAAGDVNGDGYSDVLIGAPLYSNGESLEGMAFVYHGSSLGLNTTADWSGEGDFDFAFFGNSVNTAGDVNGDGYSDIIVGSPLYNNGEKFEGMAFIYHGSSLGLSTTADWTAESDQAFALFGSSVSTAGDMNGDGFSDIIIGARNYDNGETDEGMAALYLGSSEGVSPTTYWTAEGNQNNASFGWSVSVAGDVNGDGYSDVIVGAPLYGNGEVYEGMASVFHGSISGPRIPSFNWKNESNQYYALFGWSVCTAGDVNGDGYSDIIVGAPAFDNGEDDEGMAFVYHGSPSGMSAVADWTAESNQGAAYLGISVSSAGDVNGDGYSDVVVGAHRYDNSEIDEGKAFVYHGSSSGLSSVADWTAVSNQKIAYFGVSVSTAGDVNGDGYDDVIIGAYGYDNGETDEGMAFVYHGASSGLSLVADWTAESDQDIGILGMSVSTAGDVNGDGYSDVIIGAPFFGNGEAFEGKVFVYHGSFSGLNTASEWTAESNQKAAVFGRSVSSVGDVNNDGYDDVIVGAPGYNNGQPDEGMAFVYLGDSSGLSTSPDWTAESNQEQALLGISVSTAGDVNGDGYSDIIIGAYKYDSGGINKGKAFLYLGSAIGPEQDAQWSATGNKDNAFFGWSVSTVGDFDNDGYSDVLIGAYGYGNGEIDEGLTFVYKGSASGLGTISD